MRTHLGLALLLIGCTGDPADTGADDTGEDLEPIEAGSETVTTSWDVDLYSMYDSPTIQPFDTMGGRRQLDRMEIAIDHEVDFLVQLENASPFPVTEDDYSYEWYFMTLTQLGATPDSEVDEDDEIPEDDNGGPPFFGPGAFETGPLSVALAAADDDIGGADTWSQEMHDEIEFWAEYVPDEHAKYLEAMTGDEDITVVVGGFTEDWFEWKTDPEGDGLIFAGVLSMQYAGTMTVTYHYSPTE